MKSVIMTVVWLNSFIRLMWKVLLLWQFEVLLWHCHNKAIVYFNSFIMTKNNPIAGESKFINCSRSVVTWFSVNVRKITISGKLCLQFSLLWYWKCKKKVHLLDLLDLHIKTINFLFYDYVFNSSQKWLNILAADKGYDMKNAM